MRKIAMMYVNGAEEREYMCTLLVVGGSMECVKYYGQDVLSIRQRPNMEGTPLLPAEAAMETMTDDEIAAVVWTAINRNRRIPQIERAITELRQVYPDGAIYQRYCYRGHCIGSVVGFPRDAGDYQTHNHGTLDRFYRTDTPPEGWELYSESFSDGDAYDPDRYSVSFCASGARDAVDAFFVSRGAQIDALRAELTTVAA